MKNALKFLFMTVPFIAAALAFLFYTVSNKPAPEQIALAERAVAVRIITAQEQLITPEISGFGLVTPARTYSAIPQVSGAAIYVNPDLKNGSILPAGSVLLRLSPTDFNLAIAQANANIRAAEARMTEIAISETNQTAALALEQDALALKTNDLERVKRLFDAGTVSQSAMDNARATHLTQRQKVLNLESTLALLPTQRAVQTEQIAVYETTLETAILNLNRSELTLPFAARVASVSVEIGQFVSAGKTIAQLNGVAAAEVSAQIAIADMQSLLHSAHQSSGQTLEIPETGLNIEPSKMGKLLKDFDLNARVEMDLGGQILTWPAEVDRISDTIDPKTGALGIIVQVKNIYQSVTPGTRPPLTKGMFVKVVLSAKPISATAVPRSALRNGMLLVADGEDRLQILLVPPYIVQNEVALLQNTAPTGTRIVLSTPNPIVSGMLLAPSLDLDMMETLQGISK